MTFGTIPGRFYRSDLSANLRRNLVHEEYPLMRSRWLILALILGWGFAWCPAWSTPSGVANRVAEVAPLIGQLGSRKFAEREQATRALDALGTSALTALRKAVQSDDMEVSRRAEALVRQIERRAERDAILAPTF